MGFPVSPENEVYVNGSDVWGEVVLRKVCGVVQYPVDEWKRLGMPYISGNSWCKLMMVLGSGNPEMAEIVMIAECYEGRTHDSHKYNLKNLLEKQRQRVMTGWKSEIQQEIAEGKLNCWSQVTEQGTSSASS